MPPLELESFVWLCKTSFSTLFRPRHNITTIVELKAACICVRLNSAKGKLLDKKIDTKLPDLSNRYGALRFMIKNNKVCTYRCERMLSHTSNTDFQFHPFYREPRIIQKQAIPQLKGLIVGFLNPEDWGCGILFGLPRP